MREENRSVSVIEKWQNRFRQKLAGISLPKSGTSLFKNRHFWIILCLMAVGALIYYVDQMPLSDKPFFNNPFFTSVHDLHRTIFFIPVIYATIVFRVPGSLVASLAFLIIVLPRAIFFSPYPDALVRPLVFVAFAFLISLFLAMQLNNIEKEKKTTLELNTAYTKLKKIHQQLKESQEQLIQAEKLTSLGQLAASLAHEINNPLAGVLAYSQLLIRKLKDDNISKETALDYLGKIDMEIIRTSKLVKGMMDFSRQNLSDMEYADINSIVKQSCDLVSYLFKSKNIKLVRDLTPSPPKIRCDPNQIKQVVTNLIINAVQAMSRKGILTINTSIINNDFKIEVKDTGCGISKENMRNLFVPFFSTKKQVEGVGLGLAVSYGIIQQHHGRIDVNSEEGKGSTFTIYLPMQISE